MSYIRMMKSSLFELTELISGKKQRRNEAMTHNDDKKPSHETFCGTFCLRQRIDFMTQQKKWGEKKSSNQIHITIVDGRKCKKCEMHWKHNVLILYLCSFSFFLRINIRRWNGLMCHCVPFIHAHFHLYKFR